MVPCEQHGVKVHTSRVRRCYPADLGLYERTQVLLLAAPVERAVRHRDDMHNLRDSGISGFQIIELSGYFLAAQAGERF